MKNIFNRIVVVLVIFVLLISIDALAQNEVKIELNGEVLKTDVAPIIEDGRTMVPLRPILEALGADVTWDATTKTAYAKTDKYTLVVPIGSINVSRKDNLLNKAENFTIDTVAKIKNGRTLVPVRFMAELLDKKVIWHNTERKVIILDETYVIDYLKNNASNFYEFITLPQNTSKANEASGKIEISIPIKNDEDEIENNSINLKYTSKQNEKVVSIKFEISAKFGTEDLTDLLEFFGIEGTKITFECYTDGEMVYINSNLFKQQDFVEELFYTEEDLSGGLVMNFTDEIKEEMMLDLVEKGEYNNVLHKVLIDSVNTKEDYEMLKQTLFLITKLFSNSHFIKTESGYKVEYKSIMDIINILYEDIKIRESLAETGLNYNGMFDKFLISYEAKLKNNTLQDTEFKLNTIIKDPMEEEINYKANITSETSKRDSISITKPNTLKAVNYEDLIE